MTTPGTAVVPTAVFTLDDEIKFAQYLAKSDMLPKAFQRKPESVLWAMHYGRALGIDGVIAMAAVHVIDNKPHPSAAMAAGLIRSRGHRLRLYLTPATDEHPWGTAVAELTRSDDVAFTFRAEWSVEDAVRAEICEIRSGRIYHRTLQGKTGNWQKFPRQMMKARALGEVCRDGATDALFGLHYLAEEMEDAELDKDGRLIEPTSAPTVAIPGAWTPDDGARAIGEHVAADVADVDTASPEAGPISRATQIAMMRMFTAAGIGGRGAEDRARRLRVSEILLSGEGEPRSLTSSNDLTEAEGQFLIEALGAYGDHLADVVTHLLAADDGGGEDGGEDPE